MARFALTTTGFVLIGCAVGLLVWAGYEVSLILTDYYDPAGQEAMQRLIGFVLLIAATMALVGRMLMHRAKRKWRAWR